MLKNSGSSSLTTQKKYKMNKKLYRIYEDLLDDLEKGSLSTTKKVTDEIDIERVDVDDASYFTHSMYIPVNDTRFFLKFVNVLKQTCYPLLETILENCRYIEDYSDIVFYTTDTQML